MSRDTRIVALCLAALAVIIVGSSFLATFAIGAGASEWLRWPFRLLCHGMARRCFVLAGTPMPLCARCLGIYSGLFAALLLYPLAPVKERLMRIVMFVAATPLLIDGFTQLAGLRESTNPLRLATGLTAGAAFGLWVLVAIEMRARQRFAAS